MPEFDTGDAYTDQGSVMLPGPLSRLTLTIQNAQAMVQFTTTTADGLRPNANPWNSVEYPLIPGVWTFDSRDLGGDVASVRARSKVAGVPAHVIVLA